MKPIKVGNELIKNNCASMCFVVRSGQLIYSVNNPYNLLSQSSVHAGTATQNHTMVFLP